jgi:ParB family chromosome partitioning protein
MRQLTTKPLSWFKIDNIRTYYDDEEDRLLGESLSHRQIHPLIARPDGTILDGARRHRGAEMVGLSVLEVLVTDESLSSADIREIQLISAFHRSDLTGFEKWQALLAVRAAHPTWQQQELAGHLHVSPKMIKVLLSPSDCVPEAQQALRERRIGISDCHAISSVQRAEQPELLARKLAGASRDELVREGRRRRNKGDNHARVSKVKCLLSSGVVVTVCGEGIGLDELIEALSEAQREARRARDQNLDARTWQAVMRDKAKAAVCHEPVAPGV